MLNYLPEGVSIRCKLKEWIQEMSTSFYLDGLMVRCLLCIPRITFEFIITPGKYQLPRIVLKVNDYNPVVIEQNRICPESSVILVKGITNKDTVKSMFLEYDIYNPNNASELFILVGFSGLMKNR